MKKLLLLLFLIAPKNINAQIITTYAGNGVAANTGDGGAATAAAIDYPTYGAIDKFGNYYIAIGTGNRVRKISSNGIITNFAGTGALGYTGDGGAATAAKIRDAQGVAIDTVGNVYISDAENNCIRKVDISTGLISTIAGTGTAGYSGDGGPATSALIYDPLGIRLDKFGNIYFADWANSVVRKITPLGIISTIAGDGISGYSGDGGLATNAQINAVDVCVDSIGNVYVADGVLSVRKIDTTGIITTIVGNGISGYSGDGGPATNAETEPYYITMNRNGTLYISEYAQNRIRSVNNIGEINTIAGNGTAGYSGDGGPATAALLNYPAGICLDTCGNLYIADSRSWHVRKITFDSSCGIVDSTSLSVSSPAKNIDFYIYPNPTTAQLSIANLNIVKEVTVITLLGQTISTQYFSQETVEVNLSALSSGIYLVRVTDANGNKVVRKILKE